MRYTVEALIVVEATSQYDAIEEARRQLGNFVGFRAYVHANQHNGLGWPNSQNRDDGTNNKELYEPIH